MEGPEDLDADWSNGSYECVECPPGNKHPRRSKRGAAPKRCPKHRAEKAEREKAIALNKLREERGRKPIPVPGDDDPAELTPVQTTPIEVEDEPLPAPPPHERTWLDDEEAQELLRQKRQREVDTGVTYDPDVFGTVEEFLAADLMDPEVVEAVQEQELAGYGAGSEPQGVAAPEVQIFDDLSGPVAGADLEKAEKWAREARARALVGPTADNPEPGPDNDDVCRADCGSKAVHVGVLCGPHWQKVGLDDRGILLGTKPGSDAFEQTLRRVLYKLNR